MKTGRLFALGFAGVLLATSSVAAGASPLAGPCVPGAAYDPDCDVDQNGTINITDIQLTAGHWNQSGTWTGDNNHNHLGQTWVGSNNALKIQGAFSSPDQAPLVLSNSSGEGLIVSSASVDGILVNSAGANGVYVYSAGYNGLIVNSAPHYGIYLNSIGSDGLHLNSTNANGLAVDWAGGRGLSIGTAVGDGVVVSQAGTPSTTYADSGNSNGFEVAGAQADGLYVGRADANGVYARSVGGDGLHVRSAGNPSMFITTGASNGVEVEGAQGSGLFIGRAEGDGVNVQSAGGSGAVVYNSGGSGMAVGSAGAYGVSVGSTQWDGMYIGTAGWSGIWINAASQSGVFANTTQGLGEWGFYTDDKIHGSNVTLDSVTIVARVTGEQLLEAGDVVAAVGVADPLPGSSISLALVQPALANSGIVGVVEARLVLTPRRHPAVQPGDVPTTEAFELHRADGPAQPGDYVSITVLGVAQAKVASGASALTAGARVTAAADGAVRALGTINVQLAGGEGTAAITETAPVLGVALGAAKDGMVWVFVNPQ